MEPTLTLREETVPLLHEGEPAVVLRLRWAEGDERCPGGLARLLALPPALWRDYGENTLLPLAARALRECRTRSRPFSPWRCQLDTAVSRRADGLLHVRWEAALFREGRPPARVTRDPTWDTAAGAVRPGPLPPEPAFAPSPAAADMI